MGFWSNYNLNLY